QRVHSGLAVDGVVVVTRIPDEGVVAGTHVGDVISVTTDDYVVALAAGNVVITEAAIHGQRDLAGGEKPGIDHVITAKSVGGEMIGGLGVEQVDFLGQATHRNSICIRGDCDRVVSSRGVDRHIVDLPITSVSAQDACQIDIDLRDIGPGQIVDYDIVSTA